MDMNSGQDNVQSTIAVDTYILEKLRIDWTAPHLYVFCLHSLILDYFLVLAQVSATQTHGPST